jgi:cobalt/nickel transport system permease protein
VELALSGTSPLQLALPAMAGVHVLIGLGEALITVAFLAYVMKVRPEALRDQGGAAAPAFLAGLAIALIVACCSPMASSSPDGLEAVAETQGFLTAAREAPYSLLPDYTIPGLEHPVATTILAVVLGTVLVGGLGLLVGKTLTRNHA